ncbi:asparagine synthase (glutamine-hydrolyzing) [Nitratiruptor sp. YY09-18]|uniref:asparagine synthase (glutamine-hydrolyzing) n=1 Tax=Nitratiruptor sp. YY09-18 TaxID=2724901 RepID=UPI001914F269|nr:asparagine synthase (glutamine-hydrolyzing) [Nitratiruptor sp. YY09-18]BCD67750.1 asparagine synthase (glutamine-hydrolysing) [Nitratiruptor sp. YY09-18]
MCGIVGYNFNNAALLDEMLQTIHYRGPDDKGVYANDSISLGHVRLSILDLSSHGHQPMEFENLVLIYNGEIYNFKEIRKELEKYGYSFISNSDSEVLLKAFHKWGKECVEKLRGMFAFALYDKAHQKITLCRDRVGVKPLYYYFDGKDFVFASELRALRKYKKFPIDKVALAQFFAYGYITHDRSIFEGVKKLLPAHFLEFDLKNKKLTLQNYWKYEDYFKIAAKSEEEIIDELEEVLTEGIKYRMVSDVDVGVFLSGGVDSSLVSAILQKHYGNIHTFTIGFKEQKYNEALYAKKVANHIQSNHTEYILGINEAKEILLEKFHEIYDEPFGDSSGIPTFLVSRIAKENGVKVVLSADGGDELFCGYERYWWSYHLGKKLQKIPAHKIFAKALHACKPCLSKIPIKNIEHKLEFLQELFQADSWAQIYDAILKNYREDMRCLGLVPPSNISKDAFAFGEQIHPMQGMMLWDFYNYLPNDILVKVDRATMINSIEGREPLLDNKIIEYSATISFDLKYRNGQSKYILKKVLERYLPKELIYRKKMGFGIPMFEWFRSDLAALFERYFYEDEIIDMEYPRALLQSFKEGRYVNVNKLWFVLVYKMWKERYY